MLRLDEAGLREEGARDGRSLLKRDKAWRRRFGLIKVIREESDALRKDGLKCDFNRLKM